MELDELKQHWMEHDKKLDLSIRLNRQLLRETYTGRAKRALWRLAAMLAVGSLMMLVVVISLGRFIATNWATPSVAIAGVMLDAAAIATLGALIAQIALALDIDYCQPVAVIQKRLQTLRKFRIRYIQCICLIAALTWAFVFIVLMKALRFGIWWIAINVAIGLAVMAVVIWIVQKYGPRIGLAGYNLKAASGFMATLAEFEADYSSQERSSIREYSPDE